MIQYKALKAAPPNPSISQLLDERLADLESMGKARAQNSPFYHRPLHEALGSLTADQLNRVHLAEYRKARAHRSGSLIEELRELKTALKRANDDGRISFNVGMIEIPKPKPPRDLYLSIEQAQAIHDAASAPHLKAFIKIAMRTGARKSAILQLTWDRVDLVGGRIDFRDPTQAVTNKRRALVPIPPDLKTALTRLRQHAETTFVIEHLGKPVKDIKKSFKRAAVKAGVPDATPHVMKHSFISWLAQEGIPMDKAGAMTATDPRTLRRVYLHFDPNYLADVEAVTANFGNFSDKPEELTA
ncbi:MAG: site-specific integrase [Alphaproteobacteria bacterium]|nr:site-specific integrase [Alphaproteobacteria bacterium SS10]